MYSSWYLTRLSSVFVSNRIFSPHFFSLDNEGSGDYDDDYDYDDEVSSGAGKKTGGVAKDDDEDDDDDDDDVAAAAAADDDSLEKAVDVDEKELDVDEDEDDESTPTTTQSASSSTPKIKDDIHFVEEDDSEVQIEQEPKTKGRKPSNVDKTSNKQKDDLLYEYYSEYYDNEDYDDLGDNKVDNSKKKPVAGLPPVIATSTSKTIYVDFEEDSESTETEKSVIFPPSYIFLIIASALVSFTVFMLAFLVCRRTVAARRQKKLMPFVVSSTSYGPPSLSTTVKSSSIVKNYQRVPTSTKEFLYQQQQQQQEQQEQLSEQSLQKLLT